VVNEDDEAYRALPRAALSRTLASRTPLAHRW
jgi:hypothetical protein